MCTLTCSSTKLLCSSVGTWFCLQATACNCNLYEQYGCSLLEHQAVVSERGDVVMFALVNGGAAVVCGRLWLCERFGARVCLVADCPTVAGCWLLVVYVPVVVQSINVQLCRTQLHGTRCWIQAQLDVKRFKPMLYGSLTVDWAAAFAARVRSTHVRLGGSGNELC